MKEPYYRKWGGLVSITDIITIIEFLLGTFSIDPRGIRSKFDEI